MKIELKKNQILYWNGFSDYNYKWNFDVLYKVVFYDKQNYEFKTNFIFHSKEKKIYYQNLLKILPYEKINWEYENILDENGKLQQFGSTENFIFNCTKYIGDKDIDDNQRDQVLNHFPNPFNFSEDLNNNELNFNRDVIKKWWKNNNAIIIKNILDNKDEYNLEIDKSINDIKIKDQ